MGNRQTGGSVQVRMYRTALKVGPISLVYCKDSIQYVYFIQ